MNLYHIKSLEEYHQAYRRSVEEPEIFWEDIALNNFEWYAPWKRVLEWDFSKPEIKWFDGAQLNITEN